MYKRQPVYQYFSSDDCSNDSSRDPDFICSESEEESFFSSDTDDEKDLSRQRKRKLCPRYVDDQDLNEAKRSNLTKDLEKRIILFLRVKMTRVCLTLSLIN